MRLWIWWQKLDISHSLVQTWFFTRTYSPKFLVSNIAGPSSRPGWLSVASWHSPAVASDSVEACSFGNDKGIVFAKLRPIVNRCDSTPTKIYKNHFFMRLLATNGPNSLLLFSEGIFTLILTFFTCKMHPTVSRNADKQPTWRTWAQSQRVKQCYWHAFLLALIIHRGLSMLDIFPATTTKDPQSPLGNFANFSENESGVQSVQGLKCWGNANSCWSRMTPF